MHKEQCKLSQVFIRINKIKELRLLTGIFLRLKNFFLKDDVSDRFITLLQAVSCKMADPTFFTSKKSRQDAIFLILFICSTMRGKSFRQSIYKYTCCLFFRAVGYSRVNSACFIVKVQTKIKIIT